MTTTELEQINLNGIETPEQAIKPKAPSEAEVKKAKRAEEKAAKAAIKKAIAEKLEQERILRQEAINRWHQSNEYSPWPEYPQGKRKENGEIKEYIQRIKRK